MMTVETLATDPPAAMFAAGEGRFEWKGSLQRTEPTSDEHDDGMVFLVSTMHYYAEETDAGRVKADQSAERLGKDMIRVPDVAFFKKDNFRKIKPNHSEGGCASWASCK